MSDDWDERASQVWARASDLDDASVILAFDMLAAELPETDARGPFEAAGARDYLGLEADAEPLYRRALELGLDADRAAQATIQLASTLRNLGRVDESIELLEARLREFPDDRWVGPARAFLALAQKSRGDDRQALATALVALADYLPAYSRAVRSYATE